MKVITTNARLYGKRSKPTVVRLSQTSGTIKRIAVAFMKSRQDNKFHFLRDGKPFKVVNDINPICKCKGCTCDHNK